MNQAWKKRVEHSEDSKSQNRRQKFACARCKAATSAPITTERAQAQQCPKCFGKRKDARKNQLNELSGSEWALLSKSVEKYPGGRSQKQRTHGAAFPESLAEAHIKTYTKKGDLVVDPFAGVGTTLDVAARLGRRSIGIELSKNFCNIALADLPEADDHRIICDDARNLEAHVAPESANLILTSPPYATLLKSVKGAFAYKWREHSNLNVISNPPPYSKNPKDLGNLTYEDFMTAIGQVMRSTHHVLKDEAYAVWVVKDYRDLKAGVPYVNFHGDVIDVAQMNGFRLWDIRIYDQTQFRPLVVLGYPSTNYYMNIGHSYILVFRK